MRTRPPSLFGETLKRLRLAAELSQSELAAMAGLSLRGISDLERGAHPNPRPVTVRMLADALSLSASDREVLFASARGSTPPSSVPHAIGGTTSEPGVADPPASSSPPTGTATFLFTDIEGSTQLLQRLDARYADLLADHGRLLRAAFAAHRGYVVDTQGDSFFVSFPTAPEAVTAAVEGTRALAAHSWPDGVDVRVRMGIHAGAPQVVGTQYVGIDVHRAARIAAAGYGGQILLSEAVTGLVRNALPGDISLRDLGEHRLKDLHQAERLSQLILPDLPSDFPPLRTLGAHPNNLPLQMSPIMGREREVSAVCALLRRKDVWCVTLTGPGGIGKTRLAQQVAAEVLDVFPDGVWYVRLSRLTDPGLAIPAIAQVLNLKESAAMPFAEVLREYLREKHLLFVLDNFEQIAQAAVEVARLAEVCRGVKVLVTSRVALHLHDEHEYVVSPLALPDPARVVSAEQLAQYAVGALFIERAQAARANFIVDNASAPAVAAICVRLDGLPLAIELAAARVKLLPPPALLNKLERRLPMLIGGSRDREERQQTMRSTLAWSYDLLSPGEQCLFRRLAIFVGGCTLEEAEAVCAAPEGAPALRVDVLDGLSTLVDHSLLQQREEAGEPRFGMLHVIREFALEQLEARGESDALGRAHATYFLDLAQRTQPEVRGPDARTWLARLESEHDNFRAALAWACASDAVTLGLRLAAALSYFWLSHGHQREGARWLRQLRALAEPRLATATPADDALRAAVAWGLVRAGSLVVYLGESAQAMDSLLRGLAVEETLHTRDPELRVRALNMLGLTAQMQNSLEDAARHYEEALRIARDAGMEHLTTITINNLGDLAYYRADYARALASYADYLARSESTGDHAGVVVGRQNMGRALLRQGRIDEADAYLRQSLAGAQLLRDPRRVAEAMEGLAALAGIRGEAEGSARLLGTAALLRETLGTPQPAPERADIDALVADARTRLGEAAWAAALAAGREQEVDQVVSAEIGGRPPVPTEPLR